MKEKQTKIHEGLKNLGTDLEVFYQEGVKIYNDNSPLKAHFLAHCAREIDSMIRDTFSTDIKKNLILKKLKVNKDDQKGLISSILASLGIEEETAFARKWYEISNNFAEVAHRNGRSKEPRLALEGMAIWDAYEEILYELIGNYYSLKKVIDNSFNFTKLTVTDRKGEEKFHDLIDRLPFLFKINSIKFYFFHNLESELWLKPLAERAFFEPSVIQSQYKIDNSNFISVPNWVEGQYLIKVAKSNLVTRDPGINEILNNIVNTYLLYSDANGNPVDNSTSDLYISEIIYLLPEEKKLIDTRLSFIDRQLLTQNFLSNSVVQDYLEILLQNRSKELLERTLLTLITPIKINNTDAEEGLFEMEGLTFIESSNNYQSPLKAYNLYHLFNHIQGIETVLGSSFIEKLIDLIILFNNQEPTFFDSYEIGEINYKEDKNPYSGSSFKILVQTTFALLYSNLEQNEPIILKLADSKVTILEKIFLELLSQDFQRLKGTFFRNCRSFFDKIELSNNIKVVLSKYVGEFTTDEVSNLIEHIETMLSGDDWYREGLDPAEIQRFRASTVVPFLKLFETNYPELSIETIEKWSDKIPRPDVVQDNDLLFGKIPNSPDFEVLSIEEIVPILKEEKGDLYYESQVAYRLRENIEADTSKYFTNLHLLANIKQVYRNTIVAAVREMSYANTFIYWYEFIDYLLSELDTINLNQANNFDYRFINEFSNLFIDKTSNDETAIDLELTPKLIEIYIFILNNIEPELQNIDRLQYKIGSIRYSAVLNGLFVATLRWGRNRLENEKDKFYPSAKDLFNQLLADRNSIELHYLLGSRLRNLSYLDFDWYVTIIPQIFPEDEFLWFSSFSSYLTFNHYLYVDVYKRLSREYSRAIKNQYIINNSELASSLIEHAVMYYLHHMVQDEGVSLLEIILQDRNPQLLRILVRYIISRFQHSILPEKDDKLRKIWESIYEAVGHLEDSEDKPYILGGLGNWISQIAILDEQAFALLAISFENEKGLNTLTFFESLLLHVERSPDKVGQLLVIFSNHVKEHQNYIYGIEKLTSLVGNLYKKGFSSDADSICDILGRKGFNDFSYIYAINHNR